MIAALAAAGIVAPLIFTAVALVQSLLRADHSLVAHPISALWGRDRAAGSRTRTSSSAGRCWSRTPSGSISEYIRLG